MKGRLSFHLKTWICQSEWRQHSPPPPPKFVFALTYFGESNEGVTGWRVFKQRVACWKNTSFSHLSSLGRNALSWPSWSQNFQQATFSPPFQPLSILYSTLSTSFFNHSHLLLPVECTPKTTQTPSCRLNTSVTKNTYVSKFLTLSPTVLEW